MALIINILAFVIIGIGFISLFVDVNYKLFGGLVFVAIFLKGISIVFGEDDDSNK